MQLYLIRHAEAVELGQDGVTTDEARPLTEKGRQQCPTLAKALRRLGIRIDVLLTSPLVRARQTAEGITMNWGKSGPPITEAPELAPGGKKRKLLKQVNSLRAEHVGLVGHNPDLSELVGWLLGDKRVGINLEKAGAACIEFESGADKGKGTAVWLVTPAWCEQVTG